MLIKVAASGVDRPDVIQRPGHYAPPPGASNLPGLEVAGELVEGDFSGDNPLGLKPGDAVCALLAGGGYAQYAVAHLSQCLPLPKSLTLIKAAALPENYFTVWSNVFDRGRLASMTPARLNPCWSMAAPADRCHHHPAGARLRSQGVRHGGHSGKVRGLRTLLAMTGRSLQCRGRKQLMGGLHVRGVKRRHMQHSRHALTSAGEVHERVTFRLVKIDAVDHHKTAVSPLDQRHLRANVEHLGNAEHTTEIPARVGTTFHELSMGAGSEEQHVGSAT